MPCMTSSSGANVRPLHRVLCGEDWTDDACVTLPGGGGLRHYLAHGSTQGNELIPRDFADRCIAVAIALCLPFRPTSPSIPGTFNLSLVTTLAVNE